MATLTGKMTVFQSDTKSRTVLLEGSGSFPDADDLSTGKVTLRTGETKTLTFSKMISLYFAKPTLIHLTIGSDTVDATVVGAMLLPCGGSITVENPSNSLATDPTVFSYVLA